MKSEEEIELNRLDDKLITNKIEQLATKFVEEIGVEKARKLRNYLHGMLGDVVEVEILDRGLEEVESWERE